MKLIEATGYDANDRPYQVYRFRLKDGSYLDVDKALADLSGNPEQFCRRERRLMGAPKIVA